MANEPEGGAARRWDDTHATRDPNRRGIGVLHSVRLAVRSRVFITHLGLLIAFFDHGAALLRTERSTSPSSNYFGVTSMRGAI